MKTNNKKESVVSSLDDTHSLSHTKWNCKYHVVFAPKYRRKVFYDARRLEIGKILSDLCKWKGVTIIEAEACPDHIHMLIEIPPKMSVSGFMGYLKGNQVRLFMKNGGISDTNTVVESSGAEAIMLTQLEKILRKYNSIFKIS